MDEETSPILIELKTPEARQSLIQFLENQKRRYKQSKQVQNTVNIPVEDRALFQWETDTHDMNYSTQSNESICSILNNPHTPPNSPPSIRVDTRGLPLRTFSNRSKSRRIRDPDKIEPTFEYLAPTSREAMDSQNRLQMGLLAPPDESVHARRLAERSRGKTGGKKTKKRRRRRRKRRIKQTKKRRYKRN